MRELIANQVVPETRHRFRVPNSPPFLILYPYMKKHFVKLNETYFRIDYSESIPKFIEATQSEITDHEMEQIVLKDENSLDVSVFQEVFDKARAELKLSVEQHIQDIVLKSLGFSKRYDGWEVDHCNGRMSMLTDMVTHEVKNKIIEEQLKGDWIIAEKLREELRTAMHKDFIAQYRSHMRSYLSSYIQKAISEDVKELTGELMKSKLKPITETMIDSILRVPSKTTEEV